MLAGGNKRLVEVVLFRLCLEGKVGLLHDAVIGLEKRARPGGGGRHLAATLDSGLVLELYPRHVVGTVWADEVRLGFTVSDLDATVAAVTAAGGQLISEVRPTARGWLAVVKDPDGHRVELLGSAGRITPD